MRKILLPFILLEILVSLLLSYPVQIFSVHLAKKLIEHCKEKIKLYEHIRWS